MTLPPQQAYEKDMQEICLTKQQASIRNRVVGQVNIPCA